MKKSLIPSFLLVFVLMLSASVSSFAQEKSDRKPETIDSKAVQTPNAEVDKLKKPSANSKTGGPSEPKSRGDIYGPNYSDIIVDNYTKWYIDIYVDGSYRMTLSPWEKKVTWALPGNTKLYAKAPFDDGTYYYWGPSTTRTGYEYTWTLRP